jgi:hypothetical protein
VIVEVSSMPSNFINMVIKVVALMGSTMSTTGRIGSPAPPRERVLVMLDQAMGAPEQASPPTVQILLQSKYRLTSRAWPEHLSAGGSLLWGAE